MVIRSAIVVALMLSKVRVIIFTEAVAILEMQIYTIIQNLYVVMAPLLEVELAAA